MIAPAPHAIPETRRDRRSARLAAVQALYQMELTGQDAETVAREFLDHRLRAEPDATHGPDEALFRAIVAGVPHRQAEIDRAIAACLSANWRLQRIDSILRAILRASAFELVDRKDIPARVVIDEYLEISHCFFGEEEAGFVNAVLDRLAHRDRAQEFAGSSPDERQQS
jgi:transcription antitermination protein NusB